MSADISESDSLSPNVEFFSVTCCFPLYLKLCGEAIKSGERVRGSHKIWQGYYNFPMWNVHDYVKDK